MNEEPPANMPPAPAGPPPNLPKPPNFWLMFALGGGGLVVAGGACAMFNSFTLLMLAGIGAVVSLFFKGYRGIFVGMVATVGLVLLALAVICGIDPSAGRIGP
jgi:hypothetical protein